MKLTKSIQTRKGANIIIKGEAEKIINKKVLSTTYSIKPTDFFGLMPKLLLKEGDKVKCGDPIFFNKRDSRIKFVAPVSGKIKSIVRGAKRKILELLIDSDQKNSSITHDVGFDNSKKFDKEKIKKLLLESGCWTFIKQRPYGITANPDVTPKAIFISTIDKSPLGVDYAFILKSNKENFQRGINVLNELIEGYVFLGIDKSFPGFFKNTENVNLYDVDGPHPSGNVSLHIQKITPLNPGENIWTLNPEDVSNIGSFFKYGKFCAKRTIAIAGNSVKNPKYYESLIGAEIAPFLKDAMVEKNIQVRCINGNVFSGISESNNGHLGYFNNLLTVIPEGNDFRMFGWLPFVDNKIPSIYKTSLSWLFNKKGYQVDTNLNGEERALVVTGEMEKVFPFDIFPMQLIKACMIGDIEKMEALGIYEIIPEDFGLIDFANTSKIEAQEIIKKGIELMINEVG